MNQYLKYFIYFLLGVIIYYFLFNSTNANAQKLIEGFDTADLSTLLKKRRLYIKTPHKITDGGTGSKEQNAEGTFLDYGLQNVLTLDHFTKNAYESIIGGPDLKDSPENLEGVNIINLLKSDGGNIKILNVLPDIIPPESSLTSIPESLNLTFKLTNITPPVPAEPDEVSAETDEVSAEPDEVSAEPDEVSHDTGLLLKIVYGDDAFNGSLITTLINRYDSDYKLINNNTIVYGNDLTYYYLIFSFISLDPEGNNDPFGNLDLFIIIPETIPGIIGPESTYPISNSLDDFKGSGSSSIAKKIKITNEDTDSSINYYVFKRPAENLSDIVSIFLNDLTDFPLLNNQAGKTRQESVNSETQGLNYNLSIQCSHTTLFGSAPADGGDDNIANSGDVFVADYNWDGTDFVVTARGVAEENVLPITTSVDIAEGINGLSTSPTPEEIAAMTDDETRSISTFQDAKVSYQYTFNVPLDLFQYIIIFNYVETVVDVADGRKDRGGTPLINSALLTYRTYLVDDYGKFDSLMGCGSKTSVICEHFNVRGENTATYWAPKDTTDYPSTTCNPASTTSGLKAIPSSAGSCYDDPTLCCKSSGCSSFLQNDPHLCSNQSRENNYFGRIIDMTGDGPDTAKEICCGAPLHGYVEGLFNAIRQFNNTVLSTSSEKPTRRTISRTHILNYIYGSLLSLETIPDSRFRVSDDSYNPVNQSDFDEITNFLTESIQVKYIDDAPVITGGAVLASSSTPLTDTEAAATNAALNAKLTSFELKGFEESELQKTTFAEFFDGITTNNDGEIEAAIGQTSVVSKNTNAIKEGYTKFISNYISDNGIANTVENELKMNLILLNVAFPRQVMGGTSMTPFRKSFPINSFNKATLALYL